jgi:fermentation-respiration switch protein FrsA (DUF1100 family)
LRPIEQAAKLKVPKLFIAGTADRETKFEESQRIFDRAAEPKRFLALAGARHEDLHAFASAQYEAAVLEFFETHLK